MRVVRSEAPFESVAEVSTTFDACRAVLAGIDVVRHGILFDWRKSPISTDPNLHKALAVKMDALAERFERSASLLPNADPRSTKLVTRFVGSQSTSRNR